MTNHPHRQAVSACRYWWERYRTLPRWRLLARRKALVLAAYWGELAIKLHVSE